MVPPVTAKYDWILALTTIAFVASALGTGAQDVANSYATSVAAKTMTMAQAGGLAAITEFVGAVAMGAQVTDTIKNGIIGIDRFDGNPGALMLAMGCVNVASATWILIATNLDFPISTTQTTVGSLIGVGFATQAPITWKWTDGSVSQIAVAWGISPAIAAGFSATIFATLKYSVFEREDSFKWAMRLIPVYLAATGAILALFITIAAPTAPNLEAFGAGKIVGIILGVFFGCLLVTLVFFMPYFHRRLVKKDCRIRFYHIPLGPLLMKDDCPLYAPAKREQYVDNYYEDSFGEVREGPKALANLENSPPPITQPGNQLPPSAVDSKCNNGVDVEMNAVPAESTPQIAPRRKLVDPYERFIQPVEEYSWLNSRKIWGYTKWLLLQGVTRDIVTHDSTKLRDIHARANRYEDRVEHLWTYCQVVAAMLMSIAHGSNDVANAVGPWAAVYQSYQAGEVATEAPTPPWFLAVAGVLVALGFWVYGYRIARVVGNKITKMSPTRGFSIQLGAAVTVLVASRLGLPVSTTQCLTGASMGVALMNYDLGAVNWRQLMRILAGWVLTLPCAGLISGLLCLMALNTPHL